MKVTFLGTSSGIPTLTRNMSSIAVEVEEKRVWLIDCGAGTQHQLLRKGIWIGRIEKIFITHLHGDHCFDLVGIMALRSMRQIDTPFEVVGPKGVKEMIDTLTRLSSLYIGYNLQVIELEEGQTKEIGLRGDWTITAYPLTHRVPCFGYVFNEKEVPGRFDAQKAQRLGVAGAQLGRLAKGESITLADNTQVDYSACLGPSCRGRRLVFLGDTCDSSQIAAAASECNLLVHETTFEASLGEKAISTGHSTTHMAAAFAHSVRAQQLVITHFSARYIDPGNEKTVDDLLVETQIKLKELNSATTAIAAADFFDLEVKPIPQPKLR